MEVCTLLELMFFLYIILYRITTLVFNSMKRVTTVE